ncbi:hypothetical protein Y032_0024g933 [Ancylostoma ceylanicum]|uniref:Uncharacterized protein n=1 Tax=Ancylostoma ceylanicum TaxID=53326 RepID=A0A016UX53_9BILA|nr:hypothetical protein Y032_0024g933 [Ancylostoma ceylanicum]
MANRALSVDHCSVAIAGSHGHRSMNPSPVHGRLTEITHGKYPNLPFAWHPSICSPVRDIVCTQLLPIDNHTEVPNYPSFPSDVSGPYVDSAMGSVV